MVDSAMALTTTIDMAEENPPRKTNPASASCPCDRGRASTCRSGFEPWGSRSWPTTAMGRTRKVIANRYSGKAQPAWRSRSSSLASTTSTWNMRGSTITAAADSVISTNQRSGRIIQPSPSGRVAMRSMRARMSAGPSARPHST